MNVQHYFVESLAFASARRLGKRQSVSTGLHLPASQARNLHARQQSERDPPPTQESDNCLSVRHSASRTNHPH
jgi:hypothetical protein